MTDTSIRKVRSAPQAGTFSKEDVKRAVREVSSTRLSVPIGEDTRPKDRWKQGISPHTKIIDIDCT
jgi:hypothetical protein